MMLIFYGKMKKYSANAIAKNIYSQIDEDRCNTQILDSIVDYMKGSSAVDNADMHLCTKSGH